MGNFMSYKIFALVVLAVFSLSQPVMAAIYWSTLSNGANIGTIDTTTGVATIVGPTGHGGTFGVAQDPTTNILYASFGSSIGTVNKTTGAVTTIGDTTYAIYGITFDSSGQMWAVAVSGGALYKVNKATAAATVVGTAGGGFAWMDIGFNGSTLYGVSGDTLYTINTTTGAATAVASVTGACTNVMGIGFGADGTLYASDYTSAKFCTMNPATGVTTLIGATGVSFPHGGDIGTLASPTPTPAPTPAVPTLSEWAELVLAGLLVIGGCAGLCRRTTRKAA